MSKCSQATQVIGIESPSVAISRGTGKKWNKVNFFRCTVTAPRSDQPWHRITFKFWIEMKFALIVTGSTFEVFYEGGENFLTRRRNSLALSWIWYSSTHTSLKGQPHPHPHQHPFHTYTTPTPTPTSASKGNLGPERVRKKYLWHLTCPLTQPLNWKKLKT